MTEAHTSQPGHGVRSLETHLTSSRKWPEGDGASTRIRTVDLAITNRSLYQLSYRGIRRIILALPARSVNRTGGLEERQQRADVARGLDGVAQREL